MKIKNITIENFQCYYKENQIEFGDGLNLIIGNGGKGKSKLFNAFYWVLFGKIYITDYGWCSTDKLPLNEKNIKINKHEFINKKALYDAKKGDLVKCSVRVELESDKRQIYLIERSVTARRTEEQDWKSIFAWDISSAFLKVSYDTHTGTRVVSDIIAEGVVADLFPAGIRGYIWFQGESLDSLINFSNPDKLKDAVKHISYFPFYEKQTAIIEQAKRKIERAETRHLQEVNAQNAAARTILRDLERYRKNLEDETNTSKRIEDTITKMQVVMATDESKVKGLAKFSSLVSEYDYLKLEIQRIVNELSRIDEEQRRLLPILWVLRDTDELIRKSKEIINSHVEEITSAPEKKYLDNPGRAKLEEILYKDHRCYVCGCPVDEEHQERVDWIKERIRLQEDYLRQMEEYTSNLAESNKFKLFVGQIKDYPDQLLVSLSQIDKNYMKMEEETAKLQNKLKVLNDKRDKIEREIEEIKRKHNVDPRREAQNFVNIDHSIQATRANVEREQRRYNASQQTIKELKKTIKDKERELERFGTQTGVISTVEETEWKNISNALEKICRTVQEKARKELLVKIQTRANEFYKKFTQHDRGYTGEIVIDDNYSIMFDPNLNTSHEDRKKMSIINALLSLNQEALGTYYPFISDAPTSNFDPNTTHRYLMGVKDIFEQTIIMTKDVIIGDENYQELYGNSKISRIYELSSNIHISENRDPEIYEVSTYIKPLK